MTQQEKQLLLIDLCARLPYNVIVKISHRVVDGKTGKVIKEECHDKTLSLWNEDLLHEAMSNIKPYLRPMSSMTEEEYEEFCKTDKLMATLLEINKLGRQGTRECHLMVAKALGERVAEQQNWLNSHHFDYRGLIPMGLSLEATEGMYK
jgi:hypothetical protein